MKVGVVPEVNAASEQSGASKRNPLNPARRAALAGCSACTGATNRVTLQWLAAPGMEGVLRTWDPTAALMSLIGSLHVHRCTAARANSSTRCFAFMELARSIRMSAGTCNAKLSCEGGRRDGEPSYMCFFWFFVGAPKQWTAPWAPPGATHPTREAERGAASGQGHVTETGGTSKSCCASSGSCRGSG